MLYLFCLLKDLWVFHSHCDSTGHETIFGCQIQQVGEAVLKSLRFLVGKCRNCVNYSEKSNGSDETYHIIQKRNRKTVAETPKKFSDRYQKFRCSFMDYISNPRRNELRELSDFLMKPFIKSKFWFLIFFEAWWTKTKSVPGIIKKKLEYVDVYRFAKRNMVWIIQFRIAVEMEVLETRWNVTSWEG